MKTGQLLPLSALVLTVYYYSSVTISRTFEASLGIESRITSNISLRSKRKHGLVLSVCHVCFKSPSDDLVGFSHSNYSKTSNISCGCGATQT